ncbi:prephenate dehydratase [Actinomarinicola tropica]|uniref:Prephenate dehydratase n=1 Tax=Actinomarinicola tropica TaxID=2789776 RepID=A0A5Q2RRI0_9ACTN|nr:prephenate dehydratase [Actinomarinicola tropica]
MAYLGPAATFNQQALLSQPDLAALDARPLPTIGDVLAATAAGDVDLGLVPIENAIEGSVTVTLDMLAFELDLLIQREIVIDVSLNLLGVRGARLEDVREVTSIGVATAQCRRFIIEHLPGAVVTAANSTAEAAQRVAKDGDPSVAAIGTALAAEVYGLDVLAPEVEDHPGNQTRFVLVAREGVPAPTGHDKSTVVVFQRADVPGSLLSILQEFAARAINLSKLESRPTKRGLGDYCFIIDLEGHVDDELVADCLRDLRSKQADVRFLGSYPAAGDHGPALRRENVAAWKAAEEWVAALRGQVRH